MLQGEGAQKHYTKWKRPVTKDHKYMKCPEQVHPQRQKADQWLPAVGGRREQGATAKWAWGFSQGDRNVQAQGNIGICKTL